MALGKSTLAKLIAGIVKPTEGEVLVEGYSTKKKDNFLEVRKQVGIVFQNPENQIIFNHLYDELAFSLKGLPKEEVAERIHTALEEVGMQEYAETDLYPLSMGQKQRIMIAEVLARKPKYIVLDEPTTMIDTEGKDEIYRMIQKLKQEGYTIICITNLADEILLADRTFILNEGRIVEEL